MALRGNLRDFSISQLLNLINLASKTGTLIIEAPGDNARAAFREGKLAYAQMDQEDSCLATVLYKAKKLSPGQHKSIKQHMTNTSDKELGLLLINAGYLSQDEILTYLQHYYSDVIQHLFSWMEGSFHFENDMLPPDNRISIRLDLEDLIIEGSRQICEWEQLQDEIPSLDMALKFMDRPGANLQKVNLSVEEWRVVSYINPHNSIRQIAHATKMNELEIRRIVYGLMQAGLVVITRLEGASAPASSMKVPPPVNREDQRSLVNRLINRIRSL
jgi:hypothetical protein